MTNLNFSRSAFAVATLLGLGALGFSSLAAHADVTSQLGQCRAFTKEKVVRCCDQILRNNNKPLWMLESHDSCKSAAICVGKSYGVTYLAKPHCSIEVKFNDNQGSVRLTPRRPAGKN